MSATTQRALAARQNGYRILKMPPFNYCPRCGHALALRARDDGRMRPACDNCGYTHYANPALAVGVFVTDAENRVCLILRGEEPRKGFWGLPAGFMEGDETAEQAAVRECLEETGLQVALDGLYELYSYHHADHSSSGVLILYRAHVIGGALRAGTDSVDAKFFASSEIPYNQLAFWAHIQALERWRMESAG